MHFGQGAVTFQGDENVVDGTSTGNTVAAPSKTTKDLSMAKIIQGSSKKNLEAAEQANEDLANMDMVIAESRPMTSFTLAGETKRGGNNQSGANSFQPYGPGPGGARNQTAAQAFRMKKPQAELINNVVSKMGSRRSSGGNVPTTSNPESSGILDEAMN